MRFLTAGESHGNQVGAIIEGFPAQVPVNEATLAELLERRRMAPGRGPRMKTEQDKFQIVSGVAQGRTLGTPIMVLVPNQVRDRPQNPVTVPRPGHADLPGLVKYELADIHDVAERASARETVVRTVVGGLALQLLRPLGIEIKSRIKTIAGRTEYDRILDQARETGDTLGGVVELTVTGLCGGVGTFAHWDRRLDVLLGGAMFGIPGVKGVEFGQAFALTNAPGSQYHDAFTPIDGHFRRETNNAGGIEGGMSNGEQIILELAVKPIPTLDQPLSSFDTVSGRPAPAPVLRHDVTAVGAVAPIAEAVCAWELAASLVKQLGGDTLSELNAAYQSLQNKWLQRTQACKS
ncbi:MAG: chorismate synthase [Firmicutes bacterium]|nr:chorismate synthase [Bacillota bacterium]